MGTIPEYPPIPEISITIEQKISIKYTHTYVEPQKGQFLLTREQILTMKPGQYTPNELDEVYPDFPNIIAVNHGPLPPNYTHYMQQETAPSNRDHRPENPKEPTMIYIVEIKSQE